MSLEPIGLVTLLAGFACLFLGPAFAIYALLVGSLLQSATAIFLTGLGNANVQPGHLLLLFLIVALARQRDVLRGLHEAVRPGRPGFALMALLLYAAVSAFYMPRLFEGMTYTFGNGRDGAGVLLPLMPTAGNITQLGYFAGDCLCVVLVVSFTQDARRARLVAHAILFCAAADLAFAVLDQVTALTGTAETVMGPLRNTTYRMLDEARIFGIKRLVGTFPEASAYAFATLGLFGFCFSLWLEHYRRTLTGTLSLLLLASLMISTSSTAYAGAVAYLGLVYGLALLRMQRGGATYNMSLLVLAGPFVAAFVVVALQFSPPVWQALADMANDLLFNKMSTASGIERAMWNRQAIENFADTYGLGAGIGSVKASSFLTSILGNVGLFGTIAFGWFLAAMVRERADADPGIARLRRAAASGCIAYVIGGSVSGGSIDLGLIFCVLAGLACARTGPAAARDAARLPHAAAFAR